MGWVQKVEYVDAVDVEVPCVVRKQVWDGNKFVPVTWCRNSGALTNDQKNWLEKQFGKRGSRWDYSLTGNFYTMDEQVYTWFQLKWGNK